MLQGHNIISQVDFATATETYYDAVIVGSGISGAIIAKELTAKGQRVLVLEAGTPQDLSFSGYQAYLRNFYSNPSKDNNAPFPKNPNAETPSSATVKKLVPGKPDTNSYLVQNGPLALDSTYTRVTGGTTVHFESKILRMLPEDFSIRKTYGVGLDWPINYEELMPYYRIAEEEIGVSGDVDEQSFYGIHYEKDYVFPMKNLPPSYLDTIVSTGINNTKIEIDGEEHTIKVRTFPQGRNGIPNPKFNDGKGYKPRGAISAHQVEQGERCQGNNNCVPLCPVQAKYDARRTLVDAYNAKDATGKRYMDFLAQAVVSKVCVGEDENISHLEFKRYENIDSGEYTLGKVRGRVFVLATNAVENPRLLLASNIRSRSGLVGKNLMDHTYLLAWGLLPEAAGTMRGTKVTSGVADFRSGKFRNKRAPFGIDIHNDGWGWATGSPFTDVVDLVDSGNKIGPDLRKNVIDRISNQLLLAYMIEQPAEESNAITIDWNIKDNLGNPRPIINYNLSEYSKSGIALARETSKLIFQRLGAEDYSNYSLSDYSSFTYQGEIYYFRGGNHYSGTHIMGDSPETSVVTKYQQSWDHENLYIVGSGSMPTIGTSNTTLTLAGLCYMTSEHINRKLGAISSQTSAG